MSSLNTRLGVDSPLKFLREKQLLNFSRSYDPSLHIRMLDEGRRDKLTKSRQRLATMIGIRDIGSVLSHLRESQLMENVSRHLSRYKPVHSMQERMLLQDRQPIVQQTQLEPDGINDEDWEEILRKHPELRSEQSGSGKRSKNKRSKTKKRLYRRY